MVLGPTRVLNPNGISFDSDVFAGLSIAWQTDRQTDHAAWSVTIGRTYVYCLILRCGLKTKCVSIQRKTKSSLMPYSRSTRQRKKIKDKLEMRANAQRDGRPAEYRWHPLFNAAKFGWRPLLECRAVTLPRRETRWNYLGCLKLTKWSQPLVGRSSPYCGDIGLLLFNKFFSDCRYMP